MNLMDLFIRIGLDDQASAKVGGLANKLGSGLQTAAKVGIAAVSAAATGIAALTSAAINSYAEYEQLVGGVETLFKDSADTVRKYADEAYTSAGLSANEYMNTVTSFSASLLQSLGGDTAKAADYADMAIRDMSDNANKMGTDMEMIQNAYQGFAKQNYTMLDNLKLGYGGTKTEMERLLADADALSESFKLQTDENGALVYSYADVVDAIHIIQTEMGITGTTAKEASSTISGSVASMKSAWQNLLTGIADENADFESLIGNFVESVSTVGENIMPRIEVALAGAVKLIDGLAPQIVESFPRLVNDVVPKLVQSALAILGSLAKILPDAIKTIIRSITDNRELIVDTVFDVIGAVGTLLFDLLPEVFAFAVDLVKYLASGITERAPTLIPLIVGVVVDLAKTITDPNTLVSIIDAAFQLILALVDGIIAALPDLVEAAPVIIQNLVEAISQALPMLWNAAIELILALTSYLYDPRNQAQVINAGIDIVFALVKGILTVLSKMPETAMTLMNGLLNLIHEKLGVLRESGVDILQSIADGFMDNVDDAIKWGGDLIDNFIAGIKQKWNELKSAVSDVAQSIKDLIGFSEPKKGPLSNFHTYAPDMMDLFMEGIDEKNGELTAKIQKTFDFGTIGEINGESADMMGVENLLAQILTAIKSGGGLGINSISEGLDRLQARQNAAIGVR